MSSRRADRASEARWSPEEAAEFAARRDFRLVQLLSTDRRALVTARRLGLFGASRAEKSRSNVGSSTATGTSPRGGAPEQGQRRGTASDHTPNAKQRRSAARAAAHRAAKAAPAAASPPVAAPATAPPAPAPPAAAAGASGAGQRPPLSSTATPPCGAATASKRPKNAPATGASSAAPRVQPAKQRTDVEMTDAECEAELTRMGFGRPSPSAPPSPSRAAREEQALLRDASNRLRDRSTNNPDHPSNRMRGWNPHI